MRPTLARRFCLPTPGAVMTQPVHWQNESHSVNQQDLQLWNHVAGDAIGDIASGNHSLYDKPRSPDCGGRQSWATSPRT